MMTKKFSFCRSLISLCISLHLVSCAAGVDPAEDPVQPGAEENENNSENTNSENTNNENANSENNVANENEGNNAEAEAALNNSEEENFANGNGGQGNLFGQGNNNNNLLGNEPGTNKVDNTGVTNNLEANDALVNNAEAEEILTTQDSPELNQGAVDLGPAPEAVPPSRPAAASGGGVVRYVVAGGSPMKDSPSGSIVKNLEQGDHPLVSEEGEWSRTSDGYYVPAGNLTAQPIGRAKTPRQWR